MYHQFLAIAQIFRSVHASCEKVHCHVRDQNSDQHYLPVCWYQSSRTFDLGASYSGRILCLHRKLQKVICRQSDAEATTMTMVRRRLKEKLMIQAEDFQRIV